MTTAPAPAALERWRTRRTATIRRLGPPPRLTVAEWADRYRVLSREASAEPGGWRTDRAPYQREVMDIVTDPLIDTVVLMWASQTGKTECLNNVVGYFVSQDPCPMLVLQPTVEMAEAWSKDRLSPMLRDTPILRGRVRDPRSRDANNTLQHKVFPGGHITIVGANSPAGLAARPIRIVLDDEVDRYPASAGTEGDPIALADKRTTTFWNRKRIRTSTPTLKGLSRIELEYLASDQRTYHVPCPACGLFQALIWGGLKWAKDEAGHDLPETAAYACTGCGVLIQEEQKPRLLAEGRWVAAHPERRVPGFHLNALYSPWARWADLVRDFLGARGRPELLQTFVNTVLAETWEDHAGTLDAAGLRARATPYAAEVPDGVLVLTAGVDVQADRLELFVWGWGVGEEAWMLAPVVIPGDPATAPPWEALDAELARTRPGADGRAYVVHTACIDSGYQTEMVYRYCAGRYARRIYAVKGSSAAAHPVVKFKPTAVGRGASRCRLFTYGPDAAKDLFYSRLRATTPGPGYVHLPLGIPDEVLDGLLAERRVRRQVGGRVRSRYEVRTGARNEPLDGAVMARVALALSQLTPERLAQLATARATAAGPPVPAEGEDPLPPVLRPRKTRRGGGWVGGWNT